MTPDQVIRKLAAILSADVQGYSRLMEADEEGTIRTLKACMEVISGSIQQHRGRLVATGGDSVLAEFASVVDAVRCAVGIQEELKERNKDIDENRRMEFRIGVNLGDVVEEGDTILGDGVNIAARVQSLAEAGGICITGTAYDQIKNKLAFVYEYVGEQTVKNIKEPVKIYRVLMEPGVRMPVERVEVASKEKMAFPLPDKPSIAVLPFVNMSGDPNQEFFSDGITEDIITALSRIPNLFVIARNSTFTYKGNPVKVKQVSEDLGVRYVLEGSVQKSGNRVRITAQLIDALSGYHLWADRYDREMKDLFALQDEVTKKILMSMGMKLPIGKLSSVAEKYFKGKQGLDCYLKVLEGFHYLQVMSIEGNNMARRIAEEIMTRWPENPFGYSLLGLVYRMDVMYGSTNSPRDPIEMAMELAQKALAIDDNLPNIHCLLAEIYVAKREYDKGIAEAEQALALDPNGLVANESYANALYGAHRFNEAILMYEKAIRFNPFCPSVIIGNLGGCYRKTGRFEEAISAYKQAFLRNPNYIFGHIGLCSIYALMGREKEAQAEAAEVLRMNPKFSLDNYSKAVAYNYPDQSTLDNFIDSLRKAGLK
ncbi:MAG: adenylate/guanylate cyclase domain-containing protein [Deltaproteobacteria bacterium]|nr:adenylate/guanylate cyclase domain-containing protein [Deltaproteobacteria bacterium]